MTTLPPDEVHLWFIPETLDNELEKRFEAMLSAEEQHRYQRFLFAEDRRRFLVTRAAIRILLSRYDSSQQPESWQFGRNQYGRPELLEQSQHRIESLSFNISHSNGMIVIGFSADGQVGVDIESADIKRRSVDLANRYFSTAECHALVELPKGEQEQRFFDLWTLKEAFVKACGAGLKIPLRWFTFVFPAPGQIAVTFEQELAENVSCWQFWQLQYGEAYTIAFALSGGSHGVRHKVRLFELQLPAAVRDLPIPLVRQS